MVGCGEGDLIATPLAAQEQSPILFVSMPLRMC